MKKKLHKLLIILGIIFTFLILDLGLRFLLWKDIGFVSYRSFSPLFFSVSYICIIMLLMYLFPKKRKYIYILLAVIFNIYSLAQAIHFRILGSFFSLVSLFSAGEASDYLGYALQNTDAKIIILTLLSILSMIVVLILMKKEKEIHHSKKNKIITITIIVILFTFCRISSLHKLGEPVSNGAWNTWKVPRNIYNNFNNNNRSFMVSGMYEYIFRDIYLYTIKLVNPAKKEDIKEIDNYIKNLKIKKEDNEYTDIFKNKNLIMIMMESIDEILVNEETMPVLNKLSSEGLNFENRYAPFFGGGMTINSEFASVSGLYSVVNEKAIYNYNNNNYNYTLPSLFKKIGYKVNSIHMNSGEFYNRKNFHIGLGFENHYPLSDLGFDSDFAYDSNIALNDKSYNLITSKDKFVTFITTYSAHVPYNDSPMCKKILSDGNDYIGEENDEEIKCLKLLAKETDNFIDILLSRLENDGYLDNTVLVFFSDHYSYGYSKINKARNIDDSNLIQKTPLIIWSKDINHENVERILDTADIPITLFNMFGIEYNPKLYMGTDVFSNNHEEFVYFSDYSWYDGNIYSKEVDSNKYTKEISEKVNKKIEINGKIISNDYYKTLSK